ncbi:MAG: translation initiation factor IF-2 [Alphaproteobacteria bacterium]|nr:translation initiation factor IF-2 [Alphaproteobacteria bacterium]
MTEDKKPKVLSLGAGRPKLELKKPVTGAAGAATDVVRQSFSHGRSKSVVVEAKKPAKRGEEPAKPTGLQRGPEPGTSVSVNRSGRATSAVLHNLTKEEREARARALRGAASDDRAAPDYFQAELVNKPADTATEAASAEPLTRDALRQRELEELRQIQGQEKTESARKKQEDEVRHNKIQDQRRATGGAAADDRGRSMLARPGESLSGRPGLPVGRVPGVRDEEEDSRRKPGRAPLAPRRGMGDDRRPGHKVDVTRALSDEETGGRRRSVASIRRRMERHRREAIEQNAEPVKVTRDVTITEVITVQELANRMAERSVDVIKALMKLGVMATITQTIDADTAELVVTEFGHRFKRVTEADIETAASGEADSPESTKPRPPVVTVMGHVDHGKTSLLDALRHANVVAGEAGGITQHIGAYQVILPESSHGFDRVTFIDTPGHAAFTAMRSRGGPNTDHVILVVAADVGIMPQTIQPIRHAKAANVPIIVAINKMDLPSAKPDRVRQELLQHDIQVEEMGGEVLSVEISAKTKMGIDKLLEAILLQAEILDLRANPDRAAEGAVVEARLDKGRGSVATVLVKRGTLRVGDIFVAGSEFGKVRALIDDRGNPVQQATPATPVEVLGLNGTPQAGDELMVVNDEAKAREIAELRARRKRTIAAAANSPRGNFEQMMQNIKTGTAKELAVLIKGDVHGSVEAIKGALTKLTDDNLEVKVRVLDAAVGPITESDVTLAKASGAMIFGFNVRANAQAREMAKRDAVEIRYYSIIYNVIDDVKQALSGMLAPTLREKFLGNAQILQVFNITKVGKIAGCKVVEGVVKRGAKVRLLRDNVVIHEGTLKTLKRMKDEVKEVREGFECGMAFENYDNIEPNDVIECFEMEEIARTL